MMAEISFVNLLIVAAVAVGAPLLLGFLPRLRLPSVVVEIVAGIILGPSVLGLVEVDLPVRVLAVLGLAFLLFLAGLEIDLRRLHGRALRTAGLGYLVTIGLGVLIGAALTALGWTSSALLIAVALSATSLGLVVSVLKDTGQEETEAGQTIIAGATVADFAAIVLLTLFFSMSGGGAGGTLVLLGVFTGLVILLGLALSRVGRSMHLGGVLLRLQDSTAEIRGPDVDLAAGRLCGARDALRVGSDPRCLPGGCIGQRDRPRFCIPSELPDQAGRDRIRVLGAGLLRVERGSS